MGARRGSGYPPHFGTEAVVHNGVLTSMTKSAVAPESPELLADVLREAAIRNKTIALAESNDFEAGKKWPGRRWMPSLWSPREG